MSQITQLLKAANGGDHRALEDLLPLVYDELRRLAATRLSDESAGQTLQPTALVHEAYLRLLAGTSKEFPRFENQRHFFGAAAQAMRRILIERARAKVTQKMGGLAHRIDLNLDQLGMDVDQQPEMLVALDEALIELERHDQQASELVKLRFFAGLTHQQAAESMGLSRRAADRIWALARAWLLKRLKQISSAN